MTAAMPQLPDSSIAPGPGFTPSPARLAAALIFSMLVHLWLVAAITVESPEQMSSHIPEPISATIEPLAASPDPQVPLRPESRSFDDTGLRQAHGSSGPHRNNAPDSFTSSGPRLPPPTVEDEARNAPAPAVPQIMDATYYPARELDVYPVLTQPISLAHWAPAVREEARGEVLMRLLIDEAGVVNDVSIVQAEPAGSFEELAQAVLANARFSPARKDGRVVRSRVLISIRYNADAVDGGAH